VRVTDSIQEEIVMIVQATVAVGALRSGIAVIAMEQAKLTMKKIKLFL